MRKVRLGHSDVEVSALCLGTDLIGSRIDREMSFRLLDLFREKGGTFIAHRRAPAQDRDQQRR